MSPISVQTVLRTLIASMLLLSSAHCSPERHFTFAPLPPPRFSSSGSATVGAPPVRLAIGDIEVRAEAAHGARQGMGPVWEPARSELEAYLQERLVSDSSFGAWVPRRRDADFVVDIDVTIAPSNRRSTAGSVSGSHSNWRPS